MKNERYRNYCFTAFSEIDTSDDRISYCVYQKEKCPTTGKEHLQGYIELSDKLSIKQVKEMMKNEGLHLERRLGSQKQAIEYCMKKESRIGEPVIKGKPKNQGHRKDLDEIYDDIEEGMTAKEILIRHKGNAIRHINCIKKSLMIFHDLDMVDRHILEKRGEEPEINLKNIKTIVDDKKQKALSESPNFEPWSSLE